MDLSVIEQLCLVLLNLYSTIIFAEKKLWIVQDVEA